MLQFQFRPIDNWPWAETRGRRQSTFKATYTKTLDLLERELGALKAANIVIQADVTFADLRNDGMLRNNAHPRTPRIVLSFDSKFGPLSYPCDTFTDWRANLRAIALSLEALRSVDRYGVTRRAEQYKGWQALPAPAIGEMSRTEAVLFLAALLKRDADHLADELTTREEITERIREAELLSHPDKGGSAETFKRVQAARKVLLGG